MPKNILEERLRWVLPVTNKEVRLKDIVAVCPHSGRSLKRWLSAFRNGGEEALKPRSTRPKTQPNETPIRIKEEVVSLRKKTKLCALKLHWRLNKFGINLPRSTIAKILKDEGLVRKYRVRKIKYKYIKAERLAGELVEIDVKYVPGSIKGKEYFQYTAIDTASKWRYLNAYDEQSSYLSICFLKEVMERFPHQIQAIKTDNGAIFTNRYIGMTHRSDMTVKTIHALDIFCGERNIKHYLIDPGKPAQNGTVERSHREDQEKFYEKEKFRSFKDLKKKLVIWNDYYNNLEHCSLNGKTPNEMLESLVPKVLS